MDEIPELKIRRRKELKRWRKNYVFRRDIRWKGHVDDESKHKKNTCTPSYLLSCSELQRLFQEYEWPVPPKTGGAPGRWVGTALSLWHWCRRWQAGTTCSCRHQWWQVVNEDHSQPPLVVSATGEGIASSEWGLLTAADSHVGSKRGGQVWASTEDGGTFGGSQSWGGTCLPVPLLHVAYVQEYSAG